MARGLLEQPSTMSGARRRRGRAGFTLVELAIVVVIVGILAVIAVVGYRKMILSSKITEAQNMVNAIRVAQEEYRAERGFFLEISSYCPTGSGVYGVKTMWNPQCGTPNKWEVLPVHTDGPVAFAYATWGGATGFAAPTGLDWVNWAAAPTDKPWYVIHAKADLDQGGVQTELVGSSFQNTIFSRNEGQ
jgi:type IV pilus assembly protein PilA